MALGLPSGGGGGGTTAGYGGGGGKTAGYTVQKQPTMSPSQQAALGWLQGAAGLNTSQYNQTLSAIGAQQAAAYAAASAASGAANRGYGLTIRGIDQDLMYGNQLREQEQYRNVDLGRERAYGELGNANQIWALIQADLAARRGFAFRGLDLDSRATNLQYNTGMRETQSDAIARGARTAAGTIARFGDVRSQRDLGLDRASLGFDTTIQQIENERGRGKQANDYANYMYGIDMKTFDSIAQTYGIQAAQAAAQAALAKERAASDRAAASGAAAAQRNSALASLAGQQSSAYGDYMNQQLAIMQQLAGFR